MTILAKCLIAAGILGIIAIFALEANAACTPVNEVNGDLTAKLAWGNPDTNAADTTLIERSFSSGGPYTKIATVPVTQLAYTDTVSPPTSTVTYYYVVQNSSPTAGPSPVSNEVCKNFFPGPAAPTGLSIQ